MSDFEREIVRCLNRFFKSRHIQGYAYRVSQHRSAGRSVDVLADSFNPSFQLAIVCKSIIDKKLYFSQHFHAGRDKPHPVDTITEFLKESGRTGFLAVEFRESAGTANEAFLLPWAVVVSHFHNTRGITTGDARSGIPLIRTKDGYLAESLDAKKFDTSPSMDMNP